MHASALTKTLLLAIALTATASAAPANESIDERTATVADAIGDAIFNAQLDKMRETGMPDIPANALPVAMQEALGLSADTAIPLERLYDPEFQEALLEHGLAGAVPADGLSVEEQMEILTQPEVVEAMREAYGPDIGIVATPDILRALRDHPGDNKEFRAAIERSLNDLPPEVRNDLAHGFQFADEPLYPGLAEPAPQERLPTDEVLAKLDSDSRDALAGHRHLLDDHRALTHAMPSMTERERRASSKFIAQMYKPTPPPVDPDSEHGKALARWREQGYRDAPGAPRGTTLLATIEQAHLYARQNADEGDLPSTQAMYDEFMALHGESVPRTPDRLVAPGSRNHALTGPGEVTRFYSRSVFDDAVLMVEQIEADAFFPRDPSLTIAGHPASVLWALHENGA